MSNIDRIATVAILIVGFRNHDDIRSCLFALSHLDDKPEFDVFICENGGDRAYWSLVESLELGDAPCTSADDQAPALERIALFKEVKALRFRSRSGRVWVGNAPDNLGYAGGINSWLNGILLTSGWKGVWVLNPDTEPKAQALAALVARAEVGNKGMVGSTILDGDVIEHVRFRGGLHWDRLSARGISIGLGEIPGAAHDVDRIEAAMDSPSGASMYVTRQCIDKIGLMDERYFLFFEDLDWGVRAKKTGLGYASKSIVGHKRGTTTGSSRSPAEIPRISVYLEHRNGILFVRSHFPWTLPLRIIVSIFYALRFALHRAPNNFRAALHGLFAGLRGETGRPSWYR